MLIPFSEGSVWSALLLFWVVSRGPCFFFTRRSRPHPPTAKLYVVGPPAFQPIPSWFVRCLPGSSFTMCAWDGRSAVFEVSVVFRSTKSHVQVRL